MSPTKRSKIGLRTTFEPALLEHSDVEIMAHTAAACAGQVACPIHNRSVHSMRAMTQHWRGDRGIIERICEHGTGHPDPDQYAFWVYGMGEEHADAEMVHGCCAERCCR